MQEKITDNVTRYFKDQKKSKMKGGIYHKLQIDMTYNSNHIEGNKLTHDQTRYIYETNTIGMADGNLNVDDIVETSNHFRCIDMAIDRAGDKISERFIKELHLILKNGTSDSRPEDVANEIEKLIASYNKKT